MMDHPDNGLARAEAVIECYRELVSVEGITHHYIGRLVVDLLHLCDANDASPDKVLREALRTYDSEVEMFGGVSSTAPGDRYTGWDRIHDDNKTEGRPIGQQWSDEGVDYSRGYKVRRPVR